MANFSEKNVPGVLFDYERLARIGLPEAVFCEGKPRETLLGLLEKFSGGEPPILFTRLDRDIFASLPEDCANKYDYDPVSRTAFAARLPARPRGSVGVISAGAADAPAAGEALRTLEYLGIKTRAYPDCGVAGLWRLLKNLESLNQHDAIIAVAGMEGALPSVLAGLSPKPIFATPTSIGYGVSANGHTALNSMLAGCAPGVGVLNIDNGYGAACAAARVINLL